MITLRIGTSVVIPLHRRSLVAWTLAGLLLLGLCVLTLSLGELGVGPAELLGLITGEADMKVAFVLEHLRGPRLFTALGAGAALGISGALFQAVTRNPLGSPDVIGLSAGAGAGVAVATLVTGGVVSLALGSVLGVLVAIGAVALATGNGLSSTSRIIVAGIGVSAMATSVTNFVVTVTLRDEAGQLAAYLVGSLGSRNMGHVAAIAGALLVTSPVLVWLSHRLIALELGDGLADSLGATARVTRTWSVVLSVVLLAAAVAVSGPIAFVALTAPHVARRISRAPGPNLVGSAITGALVLVLADLLAQQVPVLEGLPVGVVTAGIGGLYLGYLLAQEWKKTRS